MDGTSVGPNAGPTTGDQPAPPSVKGGVEVEGSRRLKNCLRWTAGLCATEETRLRRPLPWTVVIEFGELATVKTLWAEIQREEPAEVAGVEMDVSPDQRTNARKIVVWFLKANAETMTERIPPRAPG